MTPSALETSSQPLFCDVLPLGAEIGPHPVWPGNELLRAASPNAVWAVGPLRQSGTAGGGGHLLVVAPSPDRSRLDHGIGAAVSIGVRQF